MVGGTDGVGEDQIDLAPGDMPSSIANIERVRSLPVLLAACLVAFAVVGLGQPRRHQPDRSGRARHGAVDGDRLGCTALVAVANLVALVPERRARNDILAAQLRGE